MSVVATGAKAIITLDFQQILWATNVQVQQTMRLEKIPQLDDIQVVEYAESEHSVSITVGVLKTNQQALADFGLDPTDLSQILTQPELTITIYDNTTKLPLYEATGGKFAGGSGTIDARGLWVGQWQFLARRGRYL